jgi:hypothetical protein
VNQNLKKGEHVAPLKSAKGIPHLFKDTRPLEFETEKQAQSIASRVGGEVYKNPKAGCYLIRFV